MAENIIKLAAKTDVGKSRQNNEDNFIVCADLLQQQWVAPTDEVAAFLPPADKQPQYGSLLVVADGMGGANAGEVASALAVNSIREYFTKERVEDAMATESGIAETMCEAIKQADRNILTKAQADSSTKGMGTTCVMAWVIGRKAYVAWCGDSRCYVLNTEKGSIKRVTKDHSYVQELVDNGVITPQEAFNHPMSNIITRCLGDETTRAEPDCETITLHKGDILLLCSDGLCGYCYDDQIEQVVENNALDTHEMCRRLIDAANETGGYDNVTVVMAQLTFDDSDEDNAEGSDDGMNDTKANKSLKIEPLSKKLMRYKVLILLTLLIILALIIFSLQSK